MYCRVPPISYHNSTTELRLVVNEAHAGFFVTHHADERSWHAAFEAAVSNSSNASSSNDGSSDGATDVEAVGLVQDLILLLHQVGCHITLMPNTTRCYAHVSGAGNLYLNLCCTDSSQQCFRGSNCIIVQPPTIAL
jgi:hypothetical protein